MVALLPLDPSDGGGEWEPRADGSEDTGPILIPLDGDDDGDDGTGAAPGDATDTVDPSRSGRP